MMIDMLWWYYASINFILSLLRSCKESPFIKIPHQHKNVDFLDSDVEEERNGEKYIKR